MKASELRSKDVAALEKEVSDLLRAHFGLRMQKATQQLTNHTQLGNTRRDVARVLAEEPVDEGIQVAHRGVGCRDVGIDLRVDAPQQIRAQRLLDDHAAARAQRRGDRVDRIGSFEARERRGHDPLRSQPTRSRGAGASAEARGGPCAW